MTEAEALARLQRMTDANSEPVLTAEDLADCLALSRIADANGLVPSDPSWTPTWDLNRGAAEGWRRKQAKPLLSYDFNADGQAFSRSQAVEHCARMVEHYRRRIVTTVYLGADNG